MSAPPECCIPGGRAAVAASVGLAGGLPERQPATAGQALLQSGDVAVCCWVAAEARCRRQLGADQASASTPRASRGAGGKHGRTHTGLPRAAVPVLARFLSGVRAWRLSLASYCRTGGPERNYDARRGRGRRRCHPWSRSASSSAPKPVSGPSMRNISIVRSGSTWTWLRNASTLRPVSSSIILV